ncbi:hypothetical protein G8759_25180 [Spirosoma aureum]|uniref:Phage portal protein n=1 Tax=Spirosoma aureum TaxID=2692134 RepID=A0A6G9ATF8_9BACT|nr:hypothetical protein [Spirosoma aureum]QIP15690.1 hypothetical protein G8759_25180 [Spirosoma aureum]
MAKNSKTVEYFEGAYHDVAILSSAGVEVALEHDRPANKKSAFEPSSQPKGKPSAAVPDESQFPSIGGDILSWGDGNDFPQRMVDLYNQDPIIPATLGKLSAMIQGQGLIAVLEDIGDDGKEVVRPLVGPANIVAEIQEFISNELFQLYLREMAADAAWFFNGWPEMLVSKDRTKIVQLHPLSAEEVRWCRMRPDGSLPHVYLNANYPRNNSESASTVKINAIDPYRWDAVDWLRESSFYNCVYPISIPTPGKRFYSLPHHYSLVESGWLDVHLAIPAFKKFLMKNQMTIKYHWKVDKDYWGSMYGEKYTKGSPDQKRAIKQKWLNQMNKQLTDVSKAGNSIITDVTWDPVNKLFKDHITVTAITDTMKDGKFLDDNMEAAANIYYALNWDPTISGYQGGGKGGSRSGGSDKREAYLIALQMIKPFRDMVLQPVLFTAKYNGWKAAIPKLGFRWRDTILTTLDTGAGTAKKVS